MQPINPDPVGTGPRANSRSRPLYALISVLVVGIGLLWRSGQLPLSPFIAKYGGDALWALMVFCGFGFVFRRAEEKGLHVGITEFGEKLELFFERRGSARGEHLK